MATRANVTWLIAPLIYSVLHQLLIWDYPWSLETLGVAGMSKKGSNTTKRCFYEVLEVSKSASKNEIQRSYRRLSMVYHPDKNKAEDAPERFREIATAYEVLSTPDKREVYDTRGHEGIEQMERGGGSGDGMDPFEFFNSFFGGGGGRSRHEKPKAAPIEMKLRLSLEQLYFGTIIDIEYTRQVVCMDVDDCTIKNKDCHGPGIKMVMQQFGPGFVVQNQVSDPSCVDKGLAWNKRCKACHNGATEPKTDDVEINIHRGIENGTIFKYEEAGESGLGVTPGDIIFTVFEIPHQRFVRDGADLKATMKISLLDAMVGFEKPFLHLSGEDVPVGRTKVTPNGYVLKLDRKGMPRYEKYSSVDDTMDFGDLYITFEVEYPTSLNAKQQQLIKEALGGA